MEESASADRPLEVRLDGGLRRGDDHGYRGAVPACVGVKRAQGGLEDRNIRNTWERAGLFHRAASDSDEGVRYQGEVGRDPRQAEPVNHVYVEEVHSTRTSSKRVRDEILVL